MDNSRRHPQQQVPRVNPAPRVQPPPWPNITQAQFRFIQGEEPITTRQLLAEHKERHDAEAERIRKEVEYMQYGPTDPSEISAEEKGEEESSNGLEIRNRLPPRLQRIIARREHRQPESQRGVILHPEVERWIAMTSRRVQTLSNIDAELVREMRRVHLAQAEAARETRTAQRFDDGYVSDSDETDDESDADDAGVVPSRQGRNKTGEGQSRILYGASATFTRLRDQRNGTYTLVRSVPTEQRNRPPASSLQRDGLAITGSRSVDPPSDRQGRNNALTLQSHGLAVTGSQRVRPPTSREGNNNEAAPALPVVDSVIDLTKASEGEMVDLTSDPSDPFGDLVDLTSDADATSLARRAIKPAAHSLHGL